MVNFVLFLVAVLLIIIIFRLTKPSKRFYKIIIYIFISLILLLICSWLYFQYQKYQEKTQHDIKSKEIQTSLTSAIKNKDPEYFRYTYLDKTKFIAVYFLEDSDNHIIVKDIDNILYLYKPTNFGYKPVNEDFGGSGKFSWDNIYNVSSNEVPWLTSFKIDNEIYNLVHSNYSLREIEASEEYKKLSDNDKKNALLNYGICFNPKEVGIINNPCPGNKW